MPCRRNERQVRRPVGVLIAFGPIGVGVGIFQAIAERQATRRPPCSCCRGRETVRRPRPRRETCRDSDNRAQYCSDCHNSSIAKRDRRVVASVDVDHNQSFTSPLRLPADVHQIRQKRFGLRRDRACKAGPCWGNNRRESPGKRPPPRDARRPWRTLVQSAGRCPRATSRRGLPASRRAGTRPGRALSFSLVRYRYVFSGNVEALHRPCLLRG